MDKICIIGLGLIGASLAKTLKANNKFVSACGRNKENLEKAKQLGVIDSYSLDIKEAISGAQIIIIATPVDTVEQILQAIKPHVDDSVIISDVGSTKGSVIAAARTVFGEVPKRFIGAHPLAGRENSGLEASDIDLFDNKLVILTPLANADAVAVNEVSKMWKLTGARIEIMEHNKHDDLLAMTSHLPHILAFTLVDYLTSINPGAYNYAAGGFKDFSRIASSDATMWRDVCINNKEQILKHLDNYQQTINDFSKLIKDNEFEKIHEVFFNAKQSRDAWLKRL